MVSDLSSLHPMSPLRTTAGRQPLEHSLIDAEAFAWCPDLPPVPVDDEAFACAAVVVAIAIGSGRHRGNIRRPDTVVVVLLESADLLPPPGTESPELHLNMRFGDWAFA